MSSRHLGSRRHAAVAAAGLALALAGCTNPGPSPDIKANRTGDVPPGELIATQLADAQGPCTRSAYGAPPLDFEGAVVGFSQSEPEAAAFRAAETNSIRDEARRLGVRKLLVTNAGGQLPKQINDIQSLLAQGAEVLIVAPLNSDGLDPALAAARAKGVPVFTIDRQLTNTACRDYVTFIGSDFHEQGRRAADALAKATGGTARVAVLLGTSGNNVTIERNRGFVERIAEAHPGITVAAQQTASFARDEGQAVTEQLLQSDPDITAVYAHNDEMGLGAVSAVRSAGLEPGSDVKIVSIDGTRNAVLAITHGDYNAVIESNPRFGPLVFAAIQHWYADQPLPTRIVISDRDYTAANAQEALADAY